MDSLCVLQLLNEFHLKHLHLHDFLLLKLPKPLFFLHFLIIDPLHRMDSPPLVVFNLQLANPLLLVHNLVLHLVFRLYLIVQMPLLALILHLYDLSLLGLFLLGQVDSLLYFALLLLPLLLDHKVLVLVLLLRLLVKLDFHNFLHK